MEMGLTSGVAWEVLSGDSEGVIKLWDLRDKSLLVSANTGSAICGLAFAEDVLVCGTEDARVLSFTLGPTQVSYRGVVTEGHTGTVRAVAIDQDKVFSASVDGTLRVSAVNA